MKKVNDKISEKRRKNNIEKLNYEKELSKCKTLEDITGKNALVQRIVKDAEKQSYKMNSTNM